MLFKLNNEGGNFSDTEIRDEVVTVMSAVNICYLPYLVYSSYEKYF